MKKSIFVLIVLWLSVNYVFAGSATVSWDANTEPDLAKYKIYYGQTSGVYDTQVDVGNTTSYSITNLEDNTWYYFAITASDFSGNESKFSEEVSYLVNPDTTGSPPTKLPTTTKIYNFENPFRIKDGTTIVINAMKGESTVKIEIHTETTKVFEFPKMELVEGIKNKFVWDGKDSNNQYVKSGIIYYAVIKTDKRTVIVKLAAQ